MGGELAPRQSDDVVSEHLQLHVALAVGLEGHSARVRAIAVEFHDQALVGQQKIRGDGADTYVHRVNPAMNAVEAL
ncbi:MAG TPA: hypothetical protein VGJ61_10095 [Solirubrobacterales bacterium]|jgi:hypothetical protein